MMRRKCLANLKQAPLLFHYENKMEQISLKAKNGIFPRQIRLRSQKKLLG